MSDSQLEIGFASTDEEAIEIHGFVCVVAQPVLMVPIDAQDSMEGILQAVHEGAAIVARLNGHMIGTLCLVAVPWWYNHQFQFMADRAFFVLPQFHHLGVGARLTAEGKIIADQAGMDLIITGHLSRRSNGITFTRPNVHRPKAN